MPVIAFKNLRTSNKNYVEVKNAELKLLSESRKISNLIFSLEFHQRQPVGDKIQPCTYSIYMTDDEGVVISDRQLSLIHILSVARSMFLPEVSMQRRAKPVCIQDTSDWIEIPTRSCC